MLNKDDFEYITQRLKFKPTVDLFASRLNSQLPHFISYRPDPQSMAVNAFTLEWKDMLFYAFPPFNCIPRVLQKASQDEAEGIIVVPDWPNQPWYPLFTQMIIKEIILHSRPNLLILPSQPNVKHPLHQTLQLRAAIISGKQ